MSILSRCKTVKNFIQIAFDKILFGRSSKINKKTKFYFKQTAIYSFIFIIFNKKQYKYIDKVQTFPKN